MTKDLDVQFLCKDCARYNLCEYYHRRKKDSYICKYFHLSETPKARWISVSERLPEERGVYIVTEKVFSLDDREHKGKFNIMTEQVEWSGEKWQRARFYEVIAWMPLPKPYEPQESEDMEER